MPTDTAISPIASAVRWARLAVTVASAALRAQPNGKHPSPSNAGQAAPDFEDTNAIWRPR